MKKFSPFIIAAIFLSACHNSEKSLIDPAFTDSLVTHYSPSLLSRTVDSNLLFWERRMKSNPDNFVNGPEYASALQSSFRLHGNIYDLLKADSLMRHSNEANQYKEAGILRSLASLSLLQHRFLQADSFLQKTIAIEGRSFANTFLQFDVAFEDGQIDYAKQILFSLRSGNHYGYLFRRSKYEHYDGSLDSAIACMTKAAQESAGNKYLRQVALSNAADLYVHKGDLKAARDLYIESINIDAADFHSITGLGWIALVHDKNSELAEKLFRFVQQHTQSPDALLKLEQAAEAANDSLFTLKYANEFTSIAGSNVYGRMYNKYLIDLYTNILHQPGKAVALATEEISNRPTPQVFAWLAWSLLCNNEKEKAYTVFNEHVSGKPLEGLELFYMGKLMQQLDKGYNAEQYFKAAYKNRYDLSPAKMMELDKNY